VNNESERSERKHWWPNLRYSSEICLEGLSKIMKNFSQGIRTLDRNFKQKLSEYGAEVLICGAHCNYITIAHTLKCVFMCAGS
jgi:hypothetical protein